MSPRMDRDAHVVRIMFWKVSHSFALVARISLHAPEPRLPLSRLRFSPTIRDKEILRHADSPAVYFWLKPTAPAGERERLAQSCLELLGKVPTVKQIWAGPPAATPKRDIIDASYDLGLTVIFDDLPGHDVYQERHPLHLQFDREAQRALAPRADFRSRVIAFVFCKKGEEKAHVEAPRRRERKNSRAKGQSCCEWPRLTGESLRRCVRQSPIFRRSFDFLEVVFDER